MDLRPMARSGHAKFEKEEGCSRSVPVPVHALLEEGARRPERESSSGAPHPARADCLAIAHHLPVIRCLASISVISSIECFCSANDSSFKNAEEIAKRHYFIRGQGDSYVARAAT